jgi:hypothetical protein
MNTQNILTLVDRTECPYGKGNVIENYLQGIFTRLAPKVTSSEQPVDWLVIQSENLCDVTYCSHNFFESRLEEALKSAAKPEQKIEVIKSHARGLCGSISDKDVERWMKGHLNTDFQINYLNSSFIGAAIVGYHLDMRS